MTMLRTFQHYERYSQVAFSQCDFSGTIEVSNPTDLFPSPLPPTSLFGSDSDPRGMHNQYENLGTYIHHPGARGFLLVRLWIAGQIGLRIAQ